MLQIKRYIGFKVLLSSVTGLLVGLSLMLFHVDLALVFGLLAFLLNFARDNDLQLCLTSEGR